MIDSIIGLAILVIIISAISYFDGLALQQSLSDFRSLVISSTQSPDGRVFNSPKELTFPEGQAFSALDLESWANVGAKCFEFDSGPKLSVRVSNDRGQAEFLTRLNLFVYSKCVTNLCDPTDQSNPDNCCMCCKVVFGKKIDLLEQPNCR